MIDISTLIPIVCSAALVGFYGALKYYSKTLGTNPEAFDMNKFLPIVIISVVVSIGFTLSGAVSTTESIIEFLGANFTLVIFLDTLLTTYVRGKKTTDAAK